tara:strand:- start:122 stop:754 length:633 start_codon:yes stop_codon:yes gene_type:complete
MAKLVLCGRRLAFTGFLTLSTFALPQYAAIAAEPPHGAHVHGVGRLNLAIDGNMLVVELEAPGADIVGFEHPPATADERAAVENAVRTLRAGGDIFRLPAEAACRLDAANLESPMHRDAAPAAEKHVHSGHAHPPRESRDAGRHDKPREEGHSEFHARYRFFCANPAALSRMEVRYFELFPAAEKLNVQAITPRGQFAGQLTVTSTRFDF